jgi:LacI family transcriptional regulator
MITLKDIAQEAGVSTATVSHVVNRVSSRVSDKTEIRIRKIIEKRQYVPNTPARILAAKSSRIIAGILVAPPGRNILEDPYNAAFFGEVVRAVQERNYYLMIRYEDSYEEVVQNLRSWNVDGAIFIGTMDADVKKLQEAVRMPLIFTDSYSNLARINNVGINDFQGGRLAAEYFLRQGHERLGFASFFFRDGTQSVISRRLDGFRSALEEHRITLPSTRIFRLDPADPDSLSRAGKMLSAQKSDITGLFVSSDLLAAALMDNLKSQGVRIPGDISLIGFDDLPVSRHCDPKLTTIWQNIPQKARIAAELLFRQIEKNNAGRENITLEPELVERDSVRSLRREDAGIPLLNEPRQAQGLPAPTGYVREGYG